MACGRTREWCSKNSRIHSTCKKKQIMSDKLCWWQHLNFSFENTSMEHNSSSWLRCFQWRPNTATEAIAIDYFAEDFDDTAEQEQVPWMNDRCLIRDEFPGYKRVGIPSESSSSTWPGLSKGKSEVEGWAASRFGCCFSLVIVGCNCVPPLSLFPQFLKSCVVIKSVCVVVLPRSKMI